jgi:hypothetical protein
VLQIPVSPGSKQLARSKSRFCTLHMFNVQGNWQWNDMRESEILVTVVKKKCNEYKFKTAPLSF